MNKEKFKELWRNDELEEVHEELDDGWRHGNDVYTVYRYENEYWAASYRVSGDGEYHGIREDEFELDKVYPVVKITKTIDYVHTPQRPPSPTRYVRKFHEIEAIQFPKIVSDITNLDAIADWATKIEQFEAWVAINASEKTIKYRGDKLAIYTTDFEYTEYPAGVWLVKEPGREVYTLTPDKFEALYEKA